MLLEFAFPVVATLSPVALAAVRTMSAASKLMPQPLVDTRSARSFIPAGCNVGRVLFVPKKPTTTAPAAGAFKDGAVI
jgi:hypothetical protein